MSDNNKQRPHSRGEDQPKKATPKRTTKDRAAQKTGSGSSAKKSAASPKSAESKKKANPNGTVQAAPEASGQAAPKARKAPARKAEPKRAPKAAAVPHDEPVEATERDHTASRQRRQRPEGLTPSKLLVVVGLMAVAFVGAYNFASAKSTANAAGLGVGANLAGDPLAAAAGGGCGMSGGGGGGGCCGGGGAPVEGSTDVKGDVQKIDIDTSQGSFNPNVIKAKAGVPIEMTFSQAPGGCMAGVLFPDFGISEDLTAGPKTVKLPALEPGEYTFYCQMQMISATLVVE